MLIPYLLSSFSFSTEKNSEEMTGLIVYFHNEIDTSHNWIDTALVKELYNLSNQLFKEITSSSIIKNLDNYKNSCKYLPDSTYILNPEGIKASDTTIKNFSPGYFIIGKIKSYNHLIYAEAKVYFIYQDDPLKYLELI